MQLLTELVVQKLLIQELLVELVVQFGLQVDVRERIHVLAQLVVGQAAAGEQAMLVEKRLDLLLLQLQTAQSDLGLVGRLVHGERVLEGDSVHRSICGWSVRRERSEALFSGGFAVATWAIQTSICFERNKKEHTLEQARQLI